MGSPITLTQFPRSTSPGARSGAERVWRPAKDVNHDHHVFGVGISSRGKAPAARGEARDDVLEFQRRRIIGSDPLASRIGHLGGVASEGRAVPRLRNPPSDLGRHAYLRRRQRAQPFET
jgi:hypothetical protein